MRKLIATLSIVLTVATAHSQQLHFMSQYLQHNPMYNPAAAGIAQKSSVGISYRNMWTSFPGNPKTYMAYGDFELKNLNSGIASYVYRDETGPTSRTGAQLAYSFHIKSRDNKSRFGLGLELRGLQYAIDKVKLASSLGADPALAGASNKFAVDAGAGIYWTNDKLSVGAAVSQLIQSKLQLANVPNSQQNGKLYRHYNITANYRIHTGDEMYLIPNAMVRLIENSPSEFDFGVKLDFQDKIWWNLNWRVKQSWSVQAGFKILKNIRAAYSYDYYETAVGIFNGGAGAHEVGLQFDLKNNK
ncbi:MAG: type IX secretion system membrane protein PorP/SprF [Ferruginibacter sp.]|nr:type IX secretion system membrane protein PorP/SprF [Ferruginibacter sp.]